MSNPQASFGTAPRLPRNEVIGRSGDVANVKALLTKHVQRTTGFFIFNRELVKEARAKKGWTQQEWAEKAGHAVHTATNAEQGRPIREQVARELCQALGRELDQLTKSRSDNRPLSLVVVRGLPGVGKSTIAALLAHDEELWRSFPDGVLWAALGQAPDLTAELYAWARALGDQTLDPGSGAKRASDRVAYLLRDARRLLIIDDAWTVEDAYTMAVGGQHCGILVTTRITEVARDLEAEPGTVYPLDVLNEEHGLALLASLAGPAIEGHHAAARAVVRKLEGLPLALNVCGRLLKSEAAKPKGIGVERLLNDLQDATRLLPASVIGQDLALRTVEALLRLSTDILDPQTRECFAYLAPLAPKPAHFDRAALEAQWDLPPAEAEAMADTLVARGLLEPLDDGLYWLHALLVAHAEAILKRSVS